jgi:transposase
VRVADVVPQERRAYPSDLTDAEWLLLEPLVPETRPRGQRRVHSYREILNALLSRLSSGCTWRELPHDLPP